MMSKKQEPVGDTVVFVEGKGFARISHTDLLVAKDGTKRAMAELIADYDDPVARPNLAIQYLLNTMRPGWIMRYLQIYWPDGEMREAMIKHVQNHMSPGQGNEAKAILYEGLLLALHPSETPLTFSRRTFIEFFIINEDTVLWWETMAATLQQNFRIQMVYLDAAAITSLSKWIMNPLLEAEV
jgi:hypothetical protein